jgi:hypothetical protein
MQHHTACQKFTGIWEEDIACNFRAQISTFTQILVQYISQFLTENQNRTPRNHTESNPFFISTFQKTDDSDGGGGGRLLYTGT